MHLYIRHSLELTVHLFVTFMENRGRSFSVACLVYIAKNLLSQGRESLLGYLSLLLNLPCCNIIYTSCFGSQVEDFSVRT